MSALHLPNKLPNKTSIPMGDDETRIASANKISWFATNELFLSYPPVTNHNILGPAMSNNIGVHAHICIMGNLGKMARN